MSKKLCKLVNDGFLEDHTKKYMNLVNKPKYVCTKCGRVANDEDSLCRPKKMKLDDEKKDDKKKDKKTDGFTKISDDIASEKIASKIERKVLGKKSQNKSDELLDKKFEEKFDKKVKKRIVKVSKNSIRKNPIQKDLSIENSDYQKQTDIMSQTVKNQANIENRLEDSISDNIDENYDENYEENYEENYPSED